MWESSPTNPKVVSRKVVSLPIKVKVEVEVKVEVKVEVELELEKN